jgi:hypothetical protein
MRVIANRGLRNSDTLSVLIVPVREQIPRDSVQDHAIRILNPEFFPFSG